MRGLIFGEFMRVENLNHRPVKAKNTLVYGVGINDADYPVKPVVRLGSSKRNICPFYQKWKSMLERCYSENYQLVQPTYAGCTVCDEWLTFSNFKKWLLSAGYNGDKGFELDKDLLSKNCRVYSPETCLVVPTLVNRFVTNYSYKKKSNYMVGVSMNRVVSKLTAYCHNPFSGKGECLGVFNAEHDAHEAWRKRKHELACQLAELQTDQRVADALRVRYAN